MQSQTSKGTLVIDLDGTLCTQKSFGTYSEAEPIQEMIDHVNACYDAGWNIVIYTARGMETFRGREVDIPWEIKPLTEEWLKKHGVKYHELKFFKPPAVYYVDDKAIRPEEFLTLEP